MARPRRRLQTNGSNDGHRDQSNSFSSRRDSDKRSSTAADEGIEEVTDISTSTDDEVVSLFISLFIDFLNLVGNCRSERCH